MNEHPKRKKHTGLILILIILGILVLGSLGLVSLLIVNHATPRIGEVISHITGGSNDTDPSILPDEAEQIGEDTEVQGDATTRPNLTQHATIVTNDVSDIVEKVMPSVVSITNLSVSQVQNFFGGVETQQSESAGSGFIIDQNDNELLILTNEHVISGSSTISITFVDGQVYEANVKGSSYEYDLAVVAVDVANVQQSTLDAIKVSELGDSTVLRMGEPAIAIGNSLGYGQTVTTGVISALNRVSQAQTADASSEGNANVELIQTDAAINPGNSGGPLLNGVGQVVGINSSKLVGATVEGVGYAIPISDVMHIIEDLLNQETRARVGEADRGFLGISGTTITSETSQRLGMPQGVFISDVSPGGGAAAAGLARGTIITKIEGRDVLSMEGLQSELQFFAIGDNVNLEVQVPQPDGSYEAQQVTVTLGERPQVSTQVQP